MISTSDIVAAIQIITTIAIVVVPAIADRDINPLQRRAKHAINNLKERDDDPFGLVDISEISDNPDSIEEVFFNEVWEYLDIDHNDIGKALDDEGVLEELEIGYVRKGDPGFRILLDAISQNRTINKPDVTAIGMIYGGSGIFGALDWNDSMPRGSKIAMAPNAGLFVDYGNSSLPERELVVYHPESPSLTLSLHELEMWVKEALRRKAHYATMVLAILWASASIMSLI